MKPKRFALKLLCRQFGMYFLTLFSMSQAAAQLNCDGITQMYGMFNNTTALRNQVRPINYTTGAIGGTIGGSFNIPYTDINNPPSGYYGSTTLSASQTANRFYFLNRDYQRKNIHSLNATTGALVNIENLTQSTFNFNWFVKLAVGTDNNNYSLASPVKLSGAPFRTQITRMIRFSSSTCATNNCADNFVQDMGYIPGSASFWARFLYNGDLAFSQTGDMYVFGSEFDTTTSLYTRSRIYRIRAANIPATPNTNNVIAMEYVGDITGMGSTPGLDSVSINGVAFDGAGNFFLSTTDTTRFWDNNYLYRGTIIGSLNPVVKVTTFGTLPSGYLITDLASCIYPNIAILPNSELRLEVKKEGQHAQIGWSDKTTMVARYYELERKLDHEDDFTVISRVDAAAAAPDGQFHFTDRMLPSEYGTAVYRIKAIFMNGSYAFSNSGKIQGSLNHSVRIITNPFRDEIRAEIETTKTGTMTLTLHNSAGVLITRKLVQVVRGRNLIRLDQLGQLQKGMYILRANNEIDSYSARVMKL